MSEFGDLIPEFVEESLEHLKNIEEDIIIIEQGTADNELINRVFRAVHSIKGGSSFLGLKNIERLSHEMEEIFNLVRNDELDFTSDVSSRILKSIDMLKDLLEDSEESDGYDIEANIRELNQCLKEKRASGKKESALASKAIEEELLAKLDKSTLSTLRKKGKKVYLIQFELKEESLGGKNPMEFFAEIEKTGEVLAKNVDVDLVLKDENFTGEGVPISILYATVLEKDLVAHIFGIDEKIIKEIKPDSPMEMEVLEKARTKNEEVKMNSTAVTEQTENDNKEPEDESEDAEFAVRELYSTENADEQTSGSGESVEAIEVSEGDGEIIEIEDDEETDTDTVKENNEYLTFKVGDEEYGIEITQVHEIVTLHEITPVPSAEDFTKGILNLRGDIVPVYDFRLRLSFDQKEYDYETVILIVMIRGKKVGVIVDRVSEVIQLTREQITDAPQMQQIPPNFIIGIGQKEGKFVILLKLKEIFNVGEAV
jgi:chemotaxis signal transduction protein/HPt (histidine-containing phosphotransfer) domain-containing protein